MQEEEKDEVHQRLQLPDPLKKAPSIRKLANSHNDDSAFTTYIYRVLKETCPDASLSRKAMSALNQICGDRFEALLKETRQLII